MKKIIIFGATGSLGQHVVDQALSLGYLVTAFTRNKKNVKTEHTNLSVFEGDVMNPSSVKAAVKQHDYVLVALGAGRKGLIRSQGTKHILAAMEFHGIRRAIIQTTLGAGDSKGNLNFFWKYIMFGWFLKEAFKDHNVQEDYIKSSKLDWTIVRPAAFTNGPLTRTFQHGFSANQENLKLKISRPDVAYFMLDQINNSTYINKTPGLSY